MLFSARAAALLDSKQDEVKRYKGRSSGLSTYSRIRWCVPWSPWEGTWWRGDRDSLFSKVKTESLDRKLILLYFRSAPNCGSFMGRRRESEEEEEDLFEEVK